MIESLDRRIFIHPAKVILYRIKNWFFNLIWPYEVYGINREPMNLKMRDTPSRVYLISTPFSLLNLLEPTRYCENDETTKSFFEKTWLEFETESSGFIGVKIDRKRKVAATTLLKALGGFDNKQIKELFLFK